MKPLTAEAMRNFGSEIGLNPMVVGVLCGMKKEDLEKFQKGQLTESDQQMYSMVLMKRLHHCATFFLKHTRGNDVTLREDGALQLKLILEAK